MSDLTVRRMGLHRIGRSRDSRFGGNADFPIYPYTRTLNSHHRDAEDAENFKFYVLSFFACFAPLREIHCKSSLSVLKFQRA